MQNEIKIISTNGGYSFNNIKDQTKHQMIIAFVDAQIPNHREVRTANQRGGSNNLAQIMAIYESLRYAIGMNYKKLLIKTDNHTAYWWFKNRKPKEESKAEINNSVLTQKILDRIAKMKPWFEHLDIVLVPRKENPAGYVLEEWGKRLYETK